MGAEGVPVRVSDALSIHHQTVSVDRESRGRALNTLHLHGEAEAVSRDAVPIEPAGRGLDVPVGGGVGGGGGGGVGGGGQVVEGRAGR